MVLPNLLIPPAKRIEHHHDYSPDDVHRLEADPEAAQPSRHDRTGRQNVLACLSSLRNEEEHGQGMDDIEMHDIEKQRHLPKDDDRFWKPVSERFDQG